MPGDQTANNGMQRTVLRAAADARRYTVPRNFVRPTLCRSAEFGREGPATAHDFPGNRISRALRRLGYAIGPDTVARLLREHDFSSRTNRKRLAGTRDPDRDR